MNREREEKRFANKLKDGTKDRSRINEQLRGTKNVENEHDCWASDSGSSSGSYYSDDDSSIVDWEASIKPSGEVFHIESLINAAIRGDRDTNVDAPVSKSPSPELTRRRSTKGGKLLRLIRRRESRRRSTRSKKVISGLDVGKKNVYDDSEATSEDYESGETYEAILGVDPDKRHKLGRRATLCEAYLGIFPEVFSDNARVRVAGFIPDGQAATCEKIKIGDWLRSIDSQQITPDGLENFLSGVHRPTNVKLEFRRLNGSERAERSPEPVSRKQSVMARRLVSDENCEATMGLLLKYPMGIIFLKTSGLSETGPEFQEVSYTFPRSPNNSVQSVVCCARGAFITLNHMVPHLTSGPRPISTSVLCQGELVHVTYTSRGEELLLIALPDKRCSLDETLEVSAEIARVLEFNYETLTRCFTTKTNHSSLDHFFGLSFTRIFEASSSRCDHGNEFNFESVLPASRSIRLPRDARIQIDAALNEMEAMDYRDWNEDAMDCQRLYTIIGSCLYHKEFLLGSHLTHQDLIEIHAFLRQKGLFDLITNEPVKSLLLWQRVYPISCARNSTATSDQRNPIILSDAKWFLLVVGYGYQLLAVLLESGGCTAGLEENAGPDIFYIEEAQETLKHVIKIGIPTLAEKWIAANSVSNVTGISNDGSIAKSVSSLAENLFGFIKSNEATSKSGNATAFGTRRTTDVATILKKSVLEQNITTAYLGSVYSLQTSEDSVSQGTEAVSEVSDEAAPILGRRVTKERTNASARQSDGSESDMDSDRNESQSSTMNVSDIRQNLLSQAESVVPKTLTAGAETRPFHYVQLDARQGILLSSYDGTRSTDSSKNPEILSLFNRHAHSIHKLFRNTVRFEKMLNQETEKTVVNKSLIAIKEYGALFEYEDVEYWVIGRLYASPHPRELYVCYEDSVPQNLIEMAFRLNTV